MGVRELMRILIADDHEIIRSSVIRVLQSRADVECAEATNGKEAVEKALEWKPDLILLDIRLPVLSGFDAAKEIKQHAPDIPILFFVKGGVKLDHRGGGKADQGSGWRSGISGEGGGWSGGLRSGL
jgi:CheY-like chemotaxis protein